MSRKTKRQQQISQISRKKGHYVSQDQATIEDVIEKEVTEEWIEDKVIEEFAEDKTIEELKDDKIIEDKAIEDWAEEDFQAFKKIGEKLITETLHWHKDAISSIRAIYIENLRITQWRQKKEKTELEEHAKRIKRIDTFF